MTRWGWLEIDRLGRSAPLTATAVFDGPIDNATFRAYVEQVLVPTLRRGDVVVISSALQPDFNPLELAFTKLNAFLRAVRPRTFDEVCELIAAALGLFMPDECANYVRHCGYRLTTRNSKML
jgi:hypothetical protein